MSSDEDEIKVEGQRRSIEPGTSGSRDGLTEKTLGTLVPIIPNLAQVPPGFDFLVPAEHIFIKQELELMELVCGCETNNKYSVKDVNGREMYRVSEHTNCCTRQCCGRFRPFSIVMDDFEGHEIIFKRGLAWNSCWCPCWLQKMKVYAGPEKTLIGKVVQEWTCCRPRFRVYNEEGHLVYRIKGPCCTTQCCCTCSDITFQILSANGEDEVGKISKKWGGIIKEAFSDADNFGIAFPPKTEVKIKAVLIGACLLLDFMFFERSGNTPNIHN